MNNKINLTDFDLMAMFRVAQEMVRLDNNITKEETDVFVKYAQPINMSESRMNRFVNLALNMDWIPNRILNKWKDFIGLIRKEFFTFDGYNPIKIVGNKDFTFKL